MLTKELMRRKTMNLIILIFVIMASMFAGAGGSNILSVFGGLDRFLDKAGAGDIILLYNGGYAPAEIRDFVYENKTVTGLRLEEFLSYKNSIREGGRLITDRAVPLFVDFSRRGEKIYDRDDNEITNVEEGHIWLNVSYMDMNDLIPGDVITIDIDGATIDLVIDGVMKDAAFPNADMISATRFLLNEKDFEKISQYPVFKDSDVYGIIGFVNTEDPDSVTKTISGFGGVSISRKQIPLFYLMDFISVFLMLLFSLALVAVSSVTIHFSVNFSFEEDFREIGILKAIGLENRKIRRINTFKYMAVAVVGCTAGFFLSIPFARAVLINTEQKMILVNDRSFMPNLLGCLFVAVSVTANAWISAGKVKKFSPIDAIRFGSAGERFTGKKGIRMPMCDIPSPLYLALNDILSSPTRYIGIFLAFFLCAVTLFTLDNAVSTLKSGMFTGIMYAKCDITANCYADLFYGYSEEQVISWLKKYEERLASEGMPCSVFSDSAQFASYEIKGEQLTFVTVKFINAPDDIHDYTEGEAPKNPSELALSSGISTKYGLQIGDTIRADLGDGYSDKIITGIYESFTNAGENVRVSPDSSFRGYQDEDLCIRFYDNPSVRELKNRCELISRDPFFLRVGLADEVTEEALGVTGPINSIRNILIVILLILDLMISVLMEKTFINSEKNEIALLKAVGFKESSLIKWHILRFSIVILLATLVAAVVSGPVTLFVSKPVFLGLGIHKISTKCNYLNILLLYPALVLFISAVSVHLTSCGIRRIKCSDANNIE